MLACGEFGTKHGSVRLKWLSFGFTGNLRKEKNPSNPEFVIKADF